MTTNDKANDKANDKSNDKSEKDNLINEFGSIDITKKMFPGVFKIVCLPKKRAFFAQADETWLVMRLFMEDLGNGFCDVKELLADYEKYGEENFDYAIVDAGPEYQDPTKLSALYHEAVQSWDGDLYD